MNTAPLSSTPAAGTTSGPAAPRASDILATWHRMSRWPGGRLLFSWYLGRMAPYTATIGPRVEELRPGYARVSMRDRHRVRNPFRSVHAIAMMNLAEAASGLAMLSALPPEARAIIVGLSIEYEKKARGRLTAEAKAEVPETNEKMEYILDATIRDPEGDVVARAKARWLVGPR
ncbi:MAG: DUF4442 domain-containing protein [Thermoanaerobaculia bacterium]|nr:DUF4442 domain-containing protein [Thermoanaerobaculia bacterium]